MTMVTMVAMNPPPKATIATKATVSTGYMWL